MTTKTPPNMLSPGPLFSAFASVGTSITTGGNGVQIALGTESFDPSGAFSTSTSRFTPQVAGYYFVSAMIGFADSDLTAVNVGVAITKNGTDFTAAVVRNSIEANADRVRVQCHGLVYLNGSTDYVAMAGYQDSGSSRTCESGGSITVMSAFLVAQA